MRRRFRYFRDVLPGGLRVVTVETPHLHSAMLSVYVGTGSRHEGLATNGVSHFLEHMFFRGSVAHPDSVRMNGAVEGVGGNLNGVTTRDHGYYYTPIHPDGLDVGLDVLGDMLSRPRLPDLDVEREVILEEMLDEVDERGRDIELDNLSKMALFHGHPLALKIAGTPKTVRGLNRRHLKAHLRRHYVTGNLVVAAAGPIQRGRFVDRVARAFRHLPVGPPTSGGSPPLPHPGPAIRYVEHEGSQTELRLNFRAVPEHHPDYPALQLLRRVLDDGLSSRLPFQVVEKKGLAYSIQASLEAFDDVGIFDVEAASAPGKAARVFEEICRTLATLCQGKVTPGELARARQRHRMLLEFSQDSPGELVGWFGGTELFRPPESFEERCRQVELQTAESLRVAACRYFTRENLTLVAVGPRRGRRALERAVQHGCALP